MSPIELGVQIINDTLSNHLPFTLDSRAARIQLLSTGLQESGFTRRVQMGGGPAHSFWQIEGGSMSGIANIFTHPHALAILQDVCAKYAIPCTRLDVYTVIAANDLLGCVVARLIYLCNPDPFPAPGDEQAAWHYYLGTWHPGRPRVDSWATNYAAALQAFPV